MELLLPAVAAPGRSKRSYSFVARKFLEASFVCPRHPDYKQIKNLGVFRPRKISTLELIIIKLGAVHYIGESRSVHQSPVRGPRPRFRESFFLVPRRVPESSDGQFRREAISSAVGNQLRNVRDRKRSCLLTSEPPRLRSAAVVCAVARLTRSGTLALAQMGGWTSATQGLCKGPES